MNRSKYLTLRYFKYENNLKYKDNRYSQRMQQLAQREELLFDKHKKLDMVIDEQNQKLQNKRLLLFKNQFSQFTLSKQPKKTWV